MLGLRARDEEDAGGARISLPDAEEIEVEVVAHYERATLRVGDVFQKIDADEITGMIDPSSPGCEFDALRSQL